MEKKAFLLFYDKEKSCFSISLTSYGALTGLFKIHRQLLAFVLVKFSLCQDENPQESFFPIFVSEEAEEAKIWWNQQVQRPTRSLAPDLSDRGSHGFKLLKKNG